ATKFLIYTLAGSVLMLLGGLAVYNQHAVQTGVLTFDILAWQQSLLPVDMQFWVFVAFFAGVAVKIPMWPFHTWLPDAHTEAPTAGSVILAGVLLKLGTYALIRYAVPLAPTASTSFQVVTGMAALSIIAILYGALVSLVQKDWKRLVAYSSVSHMGFCTLGVFAFNQTGLVGSMLQQINHAISTGMLFFLVGMAYDRRHTREIRDWGGLYRSMPVFTLIFFITVVSSMGFPPLNGFIGEFTVLRGVLQANLWWGAAVIAGIVLAAAYLLWLFQRITFGELSSENRCLPDLTRVELLVCVPLVILMIAIGVYPSPVLAFLEPAAKSLLQTVGR
ncbi:MAG TPA: NADH-quinone oxidoreductase subunit M, partial [Bryobacteraceae bacterium]|nr:NADH-quinone oxidoreductase subunit M [Bryobacteraceae bacterium]